MAGDKLVYFDVRARGEATRMMYALAGKDLEDERVSFEQWQGGLKAKQPLGQLPVFTCEDGELVMSNTIARYAAKKLGMMGDGLWEEAINDMVQETCLDAFGDVPTKIYMWKVFKRAPEPEDSEKVVAEIKEKCIKGLNYIQGVAEKRDLVGDPDFEGNDLQINNLKMGLGLRKPSKDFWAPVGKLTAAMAPEEKVNLLAYIVPRFGSDDPAQGEALEAFVSGLEPTFAVIRSKCPNMKEADVQLLGSELLASEVLKPGLSSREEFAVWLGALSDVDLEFILTKRKSFKEEAKQEMESFKAEREAETKRTEERREKIQEQVMAARENRSVVFNPRTGKMEQIEKKGGDFFQNPFN